MSYVTSDSNDPNLSHGPDTEPVDQAPAYLILSKEERAKGFIRPIRRTYLHLPCGTETRMSEEIAETYARNPHFYGATYCVECRMHKPVGEHGEFIWVDDGSKVGT